MGKELVNTKGADNLSEQIAALIENAKQHIVATVNSTMTATYYEIGRMIVEHEQQGKRRAEYGVKLLPDLAKRLTERFDKYAAVLLSVFANFPDTVWKIRNAVSDF